jgi:uncharacterized protein (DUF433 family)
MHDHLITSDPGGKPVIAGTHVTVEEVLKELAASEAVDVILTTHPELDRDAVQAALAFAAEKLPGFEPARETQHPAEPETFTPRTPFGKEMWALHLAAVEEAKQRGEPLLETWEDVAREVRERRGERDYFEEDL